MSQYGIPYLEFTCLSAMRFWKSQKLAGRLNSPSLNAQMFENLDLFFPLHQVKQVRLV